MKDLATIKYVKFAFCIVLFLNCINDRIGAAIFNIQIHPGMSQAQVVRYASLLGGTNDFEEGPSVDGYNFWFTNWAGPCIADGQIFDCIYDERGNLQTWSNRERLDGC